MIKMNWVREILNELSMNIERYYEFWINENLRELKSDVKVKLWHWIDYKSYRYAITKGEEWRQNNSLTEKEAKTYIKNILNNIRL